MSKIVANDAAGDACSKDPGKIPITHVIFDFDGLLMDTESMYDEATRRMMKNYGKTFTAEDKSTVLGRPGPWITKWLIETKQLPLSEDEFALEFRQQYLKISEEQPPRLMPGAERLILHLYRSGIPLAIASGSKRFSFEMNTKPHQSLMKLFHHVILSEDDPEVTRGKPDPQPYLVCAHRFEQPPKNLKNILVFEDSLVGIESAYRAGMTTVWVQDVRFKDENPKKPSASQLNFQPDLCIDSLESFQPELFGLPSFY